ncbi:putative oxidoreductase [Mucilaginibacter sp. UYP25]|uniref:MauE/DoxX family redox-associated membrane protein n=1 Tax=unclassified Mucilaginibacter TaxID=2617802 RepID=UPI00339A5F7D
MKPTIQLCLTATLILLFTYAAASKLSDTSLFRAQLYLQPFPHSLANALVFAIPALELFAIGLLCTDRTRTAGLRLSLGLLSAFTAYIGLILLFGSGQLPCSCGGILNRMSWGGHLVFNSVFVLAALIALRLHSKKREPKRTSVSL